MSEKDPTRVELVGYDHEPVSGLAGRLLRIWRRSSTRPARLALIDRIQLGPKQALTLIEAEGMRLLVATSAEGAPSFYPLNAPPAIATRSRPAAVRWKELRAGSRSGSTTGLLGRVSW